MPVNIASIKNTAYNKEVYEPAEDSFLLADCLAADAELLRAHNPRLFVEIGPGSGYVITSLALILQSIGCTHAHGFAVDITQSAVSSSQQTLQQHGVHNVEVVQSNLLTSFQTRLEGLVDVLVFNPPYVPTPDEEVDRGGIAAAWAGGNKGRVVTDRLLPQIGKLLAPDGLFYLVTVPENDPQDIIAILAKQGLDGSKLLTRSADEELLTVYRFCKTSR